jgi:TonB family protein
LPLEAINDLEKMRETLELVVTQSKEISKDKVKSPDALAMLEEASTSRSMVARDDYDANKWQHELADVREDLASSRSVVLSAVTDSPTATAPSTQTVAQNQSQQNSVITDTSYKQPAPNTTSQNRGSDNSPSLIKSTVMSQPINSPQKYDSVPQYVPMQDQRTRVIPNQTVTQAQAQNNVATQAPIQNQTQTLTQSKQQPVTQQPVVQQNNQTANVPTADAAQNNVKPTGPSANEPSKESGPMSVGSLLPYVTKQQAPVYPPAAKSLRTAGVVTVAITIDEQGNVAEIDNVTGPGLLQSAAKEAIRKWHFKPFIRDGQPVKATGFVSFNFAM